MSPWLIALVGGIYLYVAIEEGVLGNWSMCVVYAGYAFANIGLYQLARSQ